MRKFLVLVAIILLLGLPSFAATNRYNDGYNTVDSTGVIVPYASKVPYQVVVTTDTLTIAETGKVTSVVATATNTNVNLPSAAVGLSYTIVNASDTTIVVNPAIADTIKYATSGVDLDAGDSILSPDAGTGSSVTLICPVANTWVIGQMTGTWTDGGEAGN